jgi:hypothetical protein
LYEKFPSAEMVGGVSDVVASGRDVLEDIMGSLVNVVDRFRGSEIFDIVEEYEIRLKEMFVPGYMEIGRHQRHAKDFQDIAKLTCIIVHSYLLEIEEYIAIVIEVLKKSEGQLDTTKMVEASIDFLDSSINLKEQLKFQVFKTNLVEKIQEDWDLESAENRSEEIPIITISDDSLNSKTSAENID